MVLLELTWSTMATARNGYTNIFPLFLQRSWRHSLLNYTIFQVSFLICLFISSTNYDLDTEVPKKPSVRHSRLWFLKFANFVKPSLGRLQPLFDCCCRYKWILTITTFAGTLLGCGFRLEDMPLEHLSPTIRPFINTLYHFAYIWAICMLVAIGGRRAFSTIKQRSRPRPQAPSNDLEAGMVNTQAE